ncbi:hypothetical protein MA5S0422_3145 [Mycobacteroides abscessus 5S-0422]|uniref:Uncharacterized protein n=1 Tax=Mycobacteroides abscessus subsp. bolletii 1513 TaxID=1299321 RepID=X8DT96_9MYCO|nr:hypothetical protein MA5S0421_2467 [Mycobacteroides abscessus 5S-0421]EIU10463.1 hypothetical protein MA5S0304_2212 [Mycobacteroides abscessus 5S-0304]EIU14041.1 hypothetical protein MA5S0422_3145 [Mycobacteroides abscessus 5S-0422]EIU19961.1 hypothetical protein MA5S0708_5234 [Mycobacteroides abscessus 5S-0708]EIU26694.1 hypothetical protein MA5S0817_1758 [Mycobacteroides abscessus 5S-0817]EIU29035.1 hypothetical protein MA5S1212_1896 [Mycobacteroides abscessus 5S-1212]EIU43869.1 hypothet
MAYGEFVNGSAWTFCGLNDTPLLAKMIATAGRFDPFAGHFGST